MNPQSDISFQSKPSPREDQLQCQVHVVVRSHLFIGTLRRVTTKNDFDECDQPAASTAAITEVRLVGVEGRKPAICHTEDKSG